MELLAVDVEVTGGEIPAPVQVAILFMRDSEVSWSHEYLVDPQMAVTPEAFAIHGISTEYAHIHGMSLEYVMTLTMGYLMQNWVDGLKLAVYDAPKVLSVLEYWADKYCIDYQDSVWKQAIDPLVIDRHFVEHRECDRTLGSLGCAYGLNIDQTHIAAADAELAARLVQQQISEYEIVPSYQEQVGWAHEYGATRGYQSEWPLQSWSVVPRVRDEAQDRRWWERGDELRSDHGTVPDERP